MLSNNGVTYVIRQAHRLVRRGSQDVQAGDIVGDLAMEARVRYQASPSGTVVDEVALGQLFSGLTCHYHSITAPYTHFMYARQYIILTNDSIVK